MSAKPSLFTSPAGQTCVPNCCCVRSPENTNINAPVWPENTFAELKIDSLDGLQLMFALEEEFNVSIPDDDVKKLTSVQEAIAGIEKLLAAKAAGAAAPGELREAV